MRRNHRLPGYHAAMTGHARFLGRHNQGLFLSALTNMFFPLYLQ